MKLRVLNIITSLFITACIVTSCLGEDTVEYDFSTDASITAFSIKDSIVTYYPATTANGKDTTLSFGVLGSDYPFVINHNEGLIYNQDSLPIGTDVSKVVVNITADTYGIYIAAEKDSLWSETDSLNFNNPIHFKILSEYGTFGRTYTAKINVHQQDPDLMTWQKMPCNLDSSIKKQKTVYMNGHIYVFAEATEQVTVTSTPTSGIKEWTPLSNIDIPSKADYSSVMVWGNKLYILADKELFTSENGTNWSKVETSQGITKLMANIHTEHTQKIIGVDEKGYYIESEDGINWTKHELLPEGLSSTHTTFVSYPLVTNPKISRVVLMGDNQTKTDSTLVVWTQLNSETRWTELYPTEDNKACPKLETPNIIHYNDCLYALGGIPTTDSFSQLYESTDNGITWHNSDKKLSLPEEFNALYKQSKGNYSIAIDEHQFIWLTWGSTGEVWRGRINKLGFEKQ